MTKTKDPQTASIDTFIDTFKKNHPLPTFTHSSGMWWADGKAVMRTQNNGKTYATSPQIPLDQVPEHVIGAYCALQQIGYGDFCMAYRYRYEKREAGYTLVRPELLDAFLKSISMRGGVLLCWDGKATHCITHGRTTEESDAAAELGNKIKAGVGFPRISMGESPKVVRLKKQLRKLKLELLEANSQPQQPRVCS